MVDPIYHTGVRPSVAIASMRSAWALPTRWEVTARNGMSAQLWDRRATDAVELTCGLGDDYYILSLHLTSLSHAYVELDGRTRMADGLPRGSWMLVDTAGRPRAETRDAFSLMHVYVPKSLVTQTCDVYELSLPQAENALYRTGTFGDGAISTAATALAEAAVDDGPLRCLNVDRAAHDLLVDLIAALQGPSDHKRACKLSLQGRRHVEAYIAARLDQPISLDDLARVAGLSKYHFSRAFKSDYGSTPMAAVRKRRLAAAAQALATEGTPLAQIAVRFGFSDHSHFSSAFRAQYGKSPSCFRQIARNDAL